MCKIINLKEYKKAKESDIELLKNAVKNFPYSSKEVEEQCNYYLERYLKNQSNKGCY